MKITAWKLTAPVVVSAFLLAGCKDEEQARKVKALEEDLSGRVSEIESLGKNLQQAEEERTKLRGELEQAQRDASRTKDQLAEAQKQLESLRKAEQEQQESARTAVQRDPVQDSKKAITDRLSAVWLIEGDHGNSRGFAAEADGKTWLYFPATSLKGSTKLTVKDAAGATVTKFGEFQIAADANLARLEIKQDVPARFTIDPKAVLGETPRLFSVSPSPDGGAIKLDENQGGTITPTDLEFNSYNNTETFGYPVFNAETGALIAITVSAQSTTTGLWDAPSTSQTGIPRAIRLNRSIDWKPSTIGALLAERRKIDELNKLSKLLYAAAALNPGASGFTMQGTVPGGNQSPSQIFEDNKTMPAVQELIKMNANLAGQKVRVSESDIKRQAASVIGQFSNASRKAAAELRAMKVSPCHRQDAENALKWNDEADKNLAATAGH